MVNWIYWQVHFLLQLIITTIMLKVKLISLVVYFTPTQGGVTAGTVHLSGADQEITSGAFHHLQVNGTGTKTLYDSATTSGTTTINSTLAADPACTIDFNGNVRINTGGTFNDGNQTHTFAGRDWWGDGNYAGTGTMIFDGSPSAHTIHKATFYNLEVNSNNRRLFLNDSVEIINNLTIRNSIDYAYLYDYVFYNSSGLGTFTLEDNAYMYLLGDNNFPSGFATNNLGATSRVYYWAAIDQTIAGVSYGHLFMTNANTKTLAGDTEVKGNIYFYTSTLDVSANNYSLTVGGQWYNNSTGNFLCHEGEVIFNGNGNNQQIGFQGTNINEFYNLTINKTSGYAYANNNTTNDFIVQNDLNVISGQFNANGRTIYVAGNLTAIGTGYIQR